MYETVNEPIEVAATFKPGKALPVAFRWSNTLFKIAKINLTHNSKVGRDVLYSYSVSTESGDTFKISFNPNLLTWTLDQIYELNSEQ